MNEITLPLLIETEVSRAEHKLFYIPKIIGHWLPVVEQNMNTRINEIVQLLIQSQYEAQDVREFGQMIGTFEIKANERHILSLTLSNYAIAPYYANGLTLMDSLTFDVVTGKQYRLANLFK